MKFTTTAALLLVCLIALAQVSAKKHVSKSKSTFESRLKSLGIWGSAQEIDVFVSRSGTSDFIFHATIKLEFQDKDLKIPFGIGFDGFSKLTSVVDETNFQSNVLQLVTIQNQQLPQFLLDYRLIQNCVVNDNAKVSIMKNFYWRLSFEVAGNEYYQANAKTGSASSWHVEFRLKNAWEKETKDLQKNIQDLCLQRNAQLNTLKKNAITLGDQIYSLRSEQSNQNSILAELYAQSAKGKAALSEVTTEQITLQQTITTKVTQTTEILSKSLTQISAISISAGSTAAAQKDLQVKLSAARDTFADFESATVDISKKILYAQQQLELARASLVSATSSVENAAARKARQDATNAAVAAKQAAELKAIQDSIKAAQDAQAKAIADAKARDAVVATVASAQTTDIQKAQAAADAQAASVQAVLNQIAILERTSQNNQVMQGKAQEQVYRIQQLLNEQTNVADKQAAQIIFLQAEVERNKKIRLTIETERTTTLNILIAKQKQQTDALTDLDAATRNKTVYFQTKLITDLKKAEGDFFASLALIKQMAVTSDRRALNAEQKVYANGHKPEILAIVSQSVAQAKRSLLRQAQYRSLNARFAKYSQKQFKRIRMQRRKIQQKLKNKMRNARKGHHHSRKQHRLQK